MKIVLKYFILSIVFILVVACSSEDKDRSVSISPAPSESVQPDETPPSPVIIDDKSITIYLHGFSKTGYKRVGIYGGDEAIDASEESKNLVGFSTNYRGSDTNFDENIIISTSYYGDQSPDYYSQQDIQDIENVTVKYGGGIPRYAMIVAKYAKHIMAESGATKVNFLSVSMGSLVTRWLVEKNLENIAGEQRVAKWFSVEGVIAGNYGASDATLMKISNIYEEHSPEVEHMSYSWIDTNFGNRYVGSSPYYRDIQIGFESSTKDDAMQGVLSKYLLLKGKFYANDGYQLVRDTMFTIGNKVNYYNSLPPTQSYFHENHTGLKYNLAAWDQASLFFSSNRRVKLTLTHARVDDIHEEESLNAAEILFASNVYSPKLYEVANISEAIDKRDVNSGILTIHPYYNDGDTNILNQNIYDGFVKQEESTLVLEINAYEVDNSVKYSIKEGGANHIEDLGGDRFDIPLTNGTYQVSSSDWSGEIKVEIFNY